MAWDPTHPATSGAVVSAPLRDNFSVLDTLLVAPLTALANNQILVKAAGPVVAGVPTGTNGYVLTLVGGVPLWQPAMAYPLLAPDGTAAVPSYSWANNPDTGFYYTGDSFIVSVNGAPLFNFNYNGNGQFGLPQNGTVTWTNNIVNAVSTVDLLLARDGPGVLAQRNGANFQKFRVYADATNYLELTGTQLLVPDNVTPATPAAGWVGLYAKSDKKLYAKDDLGLETPLAGMQSPMVAVGDLIVGGASGAPARLGVGTTGQVLTVASGTPIWAAPTGGSGVAVVPLSLDAARFPDGTTNNAFPQPIERVSTGTAPSGAPKLVTLVYQFDQATTVPAQAEFLLWKVAIPAVYAGGTVTMVSKWSMVSATTGNFRPVAALAPIVDGTTDTRAAVFNTVSFSADVAVPATLGQQKEVRQSLDITNVAAGRTVTAMLGMWVATASNATGDRILESAWLEFA